MEQKRLGRWEEAAACYEQALRLAPGLAEAHYNLGILCRDQGEHERARACFEQTLRLRPETLQARFELANLYSATRKIGAAVEEYARILQSNPEFVGARFNLGNAYLELRRWDAAESAFRQVLHCTPHDATAWTNLGTALREQQRGDEAEAAYREAIRLDPNQAAAWTNLGGILRDRGLFAEAMACHETAIVANPELAEAYINLGNVQHQLDRYGEAIQAYQQALQLSPDGDDAWLNTGHLLREMGDVAQARRVYHALAQRRPEDPLNRLRQLATCPIVFDSREEMEAYRGDFLAAAREVAGAELPWDLTRFPLYAPECPFPLQFLDGNLRPLKEAFAAVYASYFARQAEPARTVCRRVRPRIGIVVVSQRASSFLQPFGGIVQRLDPRLFEVVVLCSAAAAPAIRAGLGRDDVRVLGFSDRLNDAIAAVRASQCDLLYHWEVGNNSANYFLPFLRLAPVQITSWGIQVTSGIPAMDAYLSSEWIESNNAQEHYTERLVRGRTMLACREPVVLPASPRGREYFGLNESQHLYGCIQNLGKFHPDFDDLLAGILRADPRGVIVVAEDPSGVAARQLRRRWARTMPDVAERMVMTPSLKHPDYLSLLDACRVLLDPPHFGGVTTTYDGLSLAKPVITWPSEYERGRYTSGLLRKLGVTATIAKDASEYIRLAVELATNPDHLEVVSNQLSAVSREAFLSEEAVREHEQLFLQLLG